MSVVLITGCSSGFGKLAATEITAAGHIVVATMRGINDKNKSAADDLLNSGVAHVVELDVTDEHSVNKGAETALKLAGQVDVIIHNAGYGVSGVVEASTPEQFTAIMDVNVIGVHRLNRALLPHMRARNSGLLIYVSSGLGRTVLPYSSIYCASKYALEAYAESLSYELCTHGIDSSILEPGAYPSNYRSNVQEPDDPSRLADYEIEQAEANRIHSNISEMLASEMAPDPRDVTGAMLTVMSLPPGERPLRVALRRDAGGLKMINQICGEVQGALLRGMALGHRISKRPQL